ncbi:RsmE family RNA methyltransferase [Acididesulfobacillus acetoxydans]|uniref:RsmE family RNA methyltransferase n=1 Tax=Acididesulfobacillus acetoxydans TaxID=1561005 RepID=UPI001F10D053|nr:RsmE family RNA methyltransferase [Acididesulfobacillus acetoxydans]
MHRFKITEMGNRAFWLRGKEREHLVRVLRLGPGDRLIGFDNSGGEWLAEVAEIAEESVTCVIVAESRPDVEAHREVVLAAGLTKGEKLEWVIQKGTELGMRSFIPLRTKRSVLRLEGGKARERVERWQKIAAEAAKQSGRVQEPRVRAVSDWAELPESLPRGCQCLIPYEAERVRGLKSVLNTLERGRSVVLLIGPEGGFDPAEVAWAEDHLQAIRVSLGPRILRAETAALAALTMVLADSGDLG